MKICTIVLKSTLISAVFATVANAQMQPNMQPPDEMQQAQQACEGDVYALCGDAIPDAERITACLRSHWKDVSHQCRAMMASYGRNHSGRRGQQK